MALNDEPTMSILDARFTAPGMTDDIAFCMNSALAYRPHFCVQLLCGLPRRSLLFACVAPICFFFCSVALAFNASLRLSLGICLPV